MNQFFHKISLKSSLQNAIIPSCRRHKFPQHRIIADWKEIVGPELAAITIPMKLTGPNHSDQNEDFVSEYAKPIGNAKRQPQTVLVCGVANAAFALRVQMSEQLILERINLYFGYRAISKIQLKAAEFAFIPKHDANIVYRKKIITADVMTDIQNTISKVSNTDLQQLLSEILHANFSTNH